MPTNGTSKPGRRAAIVAGLRTPFVKAGGDFLDLSAVDLGALLVNELVARTPIPLSEYDGLVFGQVIPSPLVSLVAREVALRTQLPKSMQAHTVARACATSIQAATDAADQIALGHADVLVAGGAESLSDAPIFASRPLAQAIVAASKAKTMAARLKAFAGLSTRDLAPVPPALKEPTTGFTMGESAEKMAQVNGISREAQDELAWRSHHRASEAWKSGKFEGEVMHVAVPPRYSHVAKKDNIVRDDTSPEALGQLRPVFDKRYGTITAGNSSPLTDGAAALILVSEEKARALGLTPLGFVRSYAYAALDPGDELLQGPAFAAPVALDRAGLTLADMDLVDMHEAFAAQVLSNLAGLRLEEVGRPARALRAARRGRSREAQRERRLDRPRPPLRGHRCAHDPLHRPRARAPQGRPRAPHRLRGRRPRRGAGAGRPRRSLSSNPSTPTREERP